MSLRQSFNFFKAPRIAFGPTSGSERVGNRFLVLPNDCQPGPSFQMAGVFGKLVLTTAFVMVAAFSSAATYFVKTNGSDAADGKSWATAFKTPAKALSKAVARDEVWVAQGTYLGTVNLTPRVKFLGGFADGDTLDKRAWLTKKTILDGNAKGAAVYASTTCSATTIIDGFYITNGSADGGIACDGNPSISNNQIWLNKGAGINAPNASPIISSCRVLQNSSNGIVVKDQTSITGCLISGNKSTNGEGGGISCEGAGMVIRGNTISSNQAVNGGGVRIGKGSFTFDQNVVTNNSASDSGGGLFIPEDARGSVQYISNNVFDSNTVIRLRGGSIFIGGGLFYMSGNRISNSASNREGGGIFAYGFAGGSGDYAYFANNLIDNNLSTNGEGGGLYIQSYYCTVVVTSNTFTRNESGTSSLGTVALANFDRMLFYNNLVASNITGAKSVGTNGFDHDNNAYFGNQLNGQKTFDQRNFNAGKSDIYDRDPLFVDGNSGNYRLTSKSPLVNSGNNDLKAFEVDLDGKARISGGTIDIGAYEYQVPTLSSFTVTPIQAGAGSTVTGTIGLADVAPDGGASVTLTSDNASVLAVPAAVTVPKGAKTASFNVTLGTPKVATSVKVTAKIGSGTATTVTVTVNPWLKAFTLANASLKAGETTTGTVTLNLAPPAGGVVLTLASDNSAVVPVDASGNAITSLTVPAGATTATFSVATRAVQTNSTGKVTISNGGVSLSASVTVAPGGASVSLTPTTVSAGGTSVGIVTIPAAFATDQTVTLASSDKTVASVDASVTIKAGRRNAAFTVKTSDVATQKTVAITATLNGAASTPANLTVTPDIAGTLTLYPSTVKGGESTLVVIQLKSAPSADTTVDVTSSDVSAPIAGSPFLISKGSTTAFFYIDTLKVTKTTSAKITATIGGKSFSTTLTIQP